MQIDILTIFPSMFEGFVNNSIIKRAIEKEVVKINIVDIRQFSNDKNKKVDDYPIGGGAGMVLKCQPIFSALDKYQTSNSKVILMSPRGKTFNQKEAHRLANDEHLIFICGHYEGVDERINSRVDEMLSIGDYILTGGELASMVISDSIIRLLEGAISKESTEDESFENDLLEYPQYTFPREFENLKVPDILFSGNHKAIAKYRHKESLKLTMKHRKDLLENRSFTKEELKLLKEIEEGEENPKWLLQALDKASKFTKGEK